MALPGSIEEVLPGPDSGAVDTLANQSAPIMSAPTPTTIASVLCRAAGRASVSWQCLYFLPLPHGQGSFRFGVGMAKFPSL